MIIDTPGAGDHHVKIPQLSELIAMQLETGKIDVIIICCSIEKECVSLGCQVVTKIVKAGLQSMTSGIHKNIIVVGTNKDRIYPNNPVKRNRKLTQWKNNIPKIVSERCGFRPGETVYSCCTAAKIPNPGDQDQREAIDLSELWTVLAKIQSRGKKIRYVKLSSEVLVKELSTLKGLAAMHGCENLDTKAATANFKRQLEEERAAFRALEEQMRKQVEETRKQMQENVNKLREQLRKKEQADAEAKLRFERQQLELERQQSADLLRQQNSLLKQQREEEARKRSQENENARRALQIERQRANALGGYAAQEARSRNERLQRELANERQRADAARRAANRVEPYRPDPRAGNYVLRNQLEQAERRRREDEERRRRETG